MISLDRFFRFRYITSMLLLRRQTPPHIAPQPLSSLISRLDLSVSRNVAAQVPEESKGACIAECVNVVSRFGFQSSRTKGSGALVDFLAASGLAAVVSDKEGFFVVMEESAFLEKGAAAVHKIFHKVRDEPTKVRARAVELLKKLSLDKLAASV
ncbi:hypothetical protein HPB52_000941 [Rhipicephalus sanguineus]|uniref:Uncharacterized protein n=1 Tax=Rhipicephalus sanguineus TaxID=34632 RepID=A0A9D4PK84_RHISA|nr:hypothetical protein HPB52_000941 [Rhipicephalus sanguineus]